MLKSLWAVVNKDTGVTSRSWWIWGIFVFFIPFVLHFDYLLNSFYNYGAGYGDSGLFARVIWRNNWWIKTPEAYTSEGISFMAIHFMPWLMFMNGLSWLIPTTSSIFYSAYMGAVYALMSVALFLAFNTVLKPKNQLHMLLLSVMAGLFAFNDIVTEGFWYAHVEEALPMLIMFFVIFLVRGMKWWTIATFILLMSQREDAGFHLTAVLGLVGLVKWVETRSLRAIRSEATYSYISTLYSILAMFAIFLIIDMHGGRSESNWELMYTGREPWAHLNWLLVKNRLIDIMYNRLDLYLGFFISIGWAIWTRDAYMAIGCLANLPWFFFNLIAQQQMNGTLSAYYGFPFILMFGWPMLGALLRHGAQVPASHAKRAFIFQALLLLACIPMWNQQAGRFEFGPSYMARWGSYSIKPMTSNYMITEQFVASFEAGVADLGTVAIEEGMNSLVWGTYRGQVVLRPKVRTPKLDTVIYFTEKPGEANDIVRRSAWRHGLNNNYCMMVTPICVLTNRTLDKLGTMTPLLMPIELRNPYKPTDRDLKNTSNMDEPY